jgi:hypothetical protein
VIAGVDSILGWHRLLRTVVVSLSLSTQPTTNYQLTAAPTTISARFEGNQSDLEYYCVRIVTTRLALPTGFKNAAFL